MRFVLVVISGLVLGVLIGHWTLHLHASERADIPALMLFSSGPENCYVEKLSVRDFRKRFGEYRILQKEDFCYLPKYNQPIWEYLNKTKYTGFAKRFRDYYLIVVSEQPGYSIWARIVRPSDSDDLPREKWRSQPLMLPQIDLNGRVSIAKAGHIGRLAWAREADALTWTRCTDVAMDKAIYVCSRMSYSVRQDRARLLKIDGLKWGSGKKKEQWDLLWQEGQWTEAGRALQAKRQ